MKNRIRIISFISIIFILLTLAVIAISLSSCNMALVDTVYAFDKCIIFLPDGEKVEGKCEKWTDFEGSDMVQVKIDGTWYLTHSTNVILIKEEK